MILQRMKIYLTTISLNKKTITTFRTDIRIASNIYGAVPDRSDRFGRKIRTIQMKTFKDVN